jgi:hypothetical protein
MTYADPFNQYSTTSEARFSYPLARYHWDRPSQPRPPQGTRWSMAPVPQASGGGTPTKRGAMDRTAGEQFVERWRASEKRARRMAKAWGEPGVPQPWSGSPADCEDATADGRGGEMDKVLAKRPTPVPWRDHDGQAPVGAIPKPSPGGLSGGAAKPIPAMAGASS